MVATRQDAWTEDDDLLLAEVVLRHIREGSTQLTAFEEVGYRLQRTPAACGFRWNSLVRKKYESAIQIAKAQRQQRKSRGKNRYIPEHQQPTYSTSASQELPTDTRLKDFTESLVSRYQEKQESDYQNEWANELGIHASFNGTMSHSEELNFDDVIRFLRNQKESYRKLRQIDKELKEKERELQRLREENATMKKELGSVQNDYQAMNEDYKALIKIMERARKLAFLGEEEKEDKVSFKMDRNGNLERVDK